VISSDTRISLSEEREESREAARPRQWPRTCLPACVSVDYNRNCRRPAIFIRRRSDVEYSHESSNEEILSDIKCFKYEKELAENQSREQSYCCRELSHDNVITRECFNRLEEGPVHLSIQL